MIQLKNVNFTYQGAETGGLHGLDLTIPDGQVLVLCGESGCGKTTLTRLLNGLIPHVFPGELTGSVTVDGRDVSHQPLYDTARLVGSVFQNPRSQFFNVDTTSEITFGCENLGLPKDEILRRLDAAVPALGLRKLLGRGIFQLSGGEKQKIACAGAFLMEPPVFVLDEPSANLDADAVLELRGILKTLRALGKTVILSEHRLYYLRGLADRYLYLRDGRIQGDYSGAEFDAIPAEERRAMGLRAGKPGGPDPPGGTGHPAGDRPAPGLPFRLQERPGGPADRRRPSPTAASWASWATTGRGSPPSPAASAAWRSAAAP